MQQITINNKQYPVDFSIAALKNFCKKKKIDFPDFDKLLTKLLTQNLSVDVAEDVGLLVLCGVENALRKQRRLNDFDLLPDDGVDIFDNTEQLNIVFTELASALPQPETEKETEEQGNA